MRILLVEDSTRLADTLTAGLTRIGHRVDHAGDGLTALRFAEERDYDAIVLDLMIPEIDGLSVLRRLRRKGIQSNVLILSAKASVGDRITGLDSGADDYLTKPFSFEELCSRLRAIDRRNRETIHNGAVLGPVSIEFDSMRMWVSDDVMDFTSGGTGRIRPRPIAHDRITTPSRLFGNRRNENPVRAAGRGFLCSASATHQVRSLR